MRQIITLCALVIVIAGLAAAYFMLSADTEEEIAAEEPPSQVRLIEDRTEDDIVRVVFSPTDSQSFAIEHVDGEWEFSDNRDLEIDRLTAHITLSQILSLTAEDVAAESVANVADFGIGRHDIAIDFQDGSRKVIRLGSLTPDHRHFYAMIEGDKSLYLINTSAGNRLKQDMTVLIDRRIPHLDPMQISYIFLHEKGRSPLEFNATEIIDQFGATRLTMVYPFAGRDLVMGHFNREVLEGFEGFIPGEVVELFAEDLSHYGLDTPSLEFIMEDAIGSRFHLLFGDFHESVENSSRQKYMMHAESPHVFLADMGHIQGLFDLNPFSLVNRFVALMDIASVELITILTADGRDFELVVDGYTINGVEVDGSEFRSAYQAMISLVYEHDVGVQENMDEDMGEPDITITYYHLDGSEPTILDFFTYDAHFYLVRQRPDQPRFVTGRISVNLIFNTLEALM